MSTIRLCALQDIADGQARGFCLGEGSDRFELLVARRGEDVFAYVNACPHHGTPLDWRPDHFMSPDGTLLQCATHGARFRIEDGLCVYGPCVGKRLTELAARLEDGDVVVSRSPGR